MHMQKHRATDDKTDSCQWPISRVSGEVLSEGVVRDISMERHPEAGQQVVITGGGVVKAGKAQEGHLKGLMRAQRTRDKERWSSARDIHLHKEPCLWQNVSRTSGSSSNILHALTSMADAAIGSPPLHRSTTTLTRITVAGGRASRIPLFTLVKACDVHPDSGGV